MKIHVVNLLEYEKGWGSKVFDTLYFKKEENALSYIKEYNSKNNLSASPDYYTKADFRKTLDYTENIIFEDSDNNTGSIVFECTGSNYGYQVLAFNNEEIDVILRNQNKNIRNHNSSTGEKEPIKYRITVKRI